MSDLFTAKGSVPNTLSAEDLTWNYERDNLSSQTKTLYIAFDDGSTAMIQSVFSSTSVKALAAFSASHTPASSPQAIIKAETHSASSLVLSNNNKSAKITDNNTLTWNSTSEHGGYSVTRTHGKELQYNLEIKFNSPGFTLGRSFLGADKKNFMEHKWVPNCSVSGSYSVGGKLTASATGTAIFIDATSTLAAHLLANQWNLLLLFNKETNTTLSTLNCALPNKYGSVHDSQGSVVVNGKRIVLVNNQVEHVNPSNDKQTSYPLPTSIRAVWNGHLAEQPETKVKVTSEFALDSFKGKIDVLAELPFLVRKVVQALVAKPFVFHWVVPQATAQIQIGQEQPVPFTGTAYLETTFVNS